MKFAPDASLGCLYTTLRNMATSARYYGFIPHRGKRLAAGEEISIFGDIRNYFNSPGSGPKKRALEQALKNGDIVIAHSPAALVYDDVRDETKALSLSNGSFSSIDPCFGAYSSSL